MPAKRSTAPKRPTRQPLEVLAVRVPPDLLAAIDEAVEREREARPAALVERPDVVREALYRVFVTEAPKGRGK